MQTEIIEEYSLIQGNTTLVPLRLMSDYLGAVVSWSAPNISLTKGNKTLKLTIGSKTAFYTFQGVTVHDYGNYCLNESLENPILVGGFSAMGFPSEGDELSPPSTAYTYSYSNTGNHLLLDFDENNKSIFSSFIAK